MAGSSSGPGADPSDSLYEDKLGVLARQYAKLRGDLGLVEDRLKTANALVKLGSAGTSSEVWRPLFDQL